MACSAFLSIWKVSTKIKSSGNAFTTKSLSDLVERIWAFRKGCVFLDLGLLYINYLIVHEWCCTPGRLLRLFKQCSCSASQSIGPEVVTGLLKWGVRDQTWAACMQGKYLPIPIFLLPLFILMLNNPRSSFLTTLELRTV